MAESIAMLIQTIVITELFFNREDTEEHGFEVNVPHATTPTGIQNGVVLGVAADLPTRSAKQNVSGLSSLDRAVTKLPITNGDVNSRSPVSADKLSITNGDVNGLGPVSADKLSITNYDVNSLSPVSADKLSSTNGDVGAPADRTATARSLPKLFLVSTLDKLDKVLVCNMIGRLGGIVLNTDTPDYDPKATHVVVRHIDITEKITAALAAGKWIVQTAYVTTSFRVGYWLPEEDFEIGHCCCSYEMLLKPYSETETAMRFMENAPRRCRQMVMVKMKPYLSHWNVGVLIDRPNSRETILRILKAGGAKVTLLSIPLGRNWKQVRKVDFVLAEVQDVKCLFPCKKFRIPCVPINYVYDYLHRDPPPSMESYSIKECSESGKPSHSWSIPHHSLSKLHRLKNNYIHWCSTRTKRLWDSAHPCKAYPVDIVCEAWRTLEASLGFRDRNRRENSKHSASLGSLYDAETLHTTLQQARKSGGKMRSHSLTSDPAYDQNHKRKLLEANKSCVGSVKRRAVVPYSMGKPCIPMDKEVAVTSLSEAPISENVVSSTQSLSAEEDTEHTFEAVPEIDAAKVMRSSSVHNSIHTDRMSDPLTCKDMKTNSKITAYFVLESTAEVSSSSLEKKWPKKRKRVTSSILPSKSPLRKKNLRCCQSNKIDKYLSPTKIKEAVSSGTFKEEMMMPKKCSGGITLRVECKEGAGETSLTVGCGETAVPFEVFEERTSESNLEAKHSSVIATIPQAGSCKLNQVESDSVTVSSGKFKEEMMLPNKCSGGIALRIECKEGTGETSLTVGCGETALPFEVFEERTSQSNLEAKHSPMIATIPQAGSCKLNRVESDSVTAISSSKVLHHNSEMLQVSYQSNNLRDLRVGHSSSVVKSPIDTIYLDSDEHTDSYVYVDLSQDDDCVRKPEETIGFDLSQDDDCVRKPEETFGFYLPRDDDCVRKPEETFGFYLPRDDDCVRKPEETIGFRRAVRSPIVFDDDDDDDDDDDIIVITEQTKWKDGDPIVISSDEEDNDICLLSHKKYAKDVLPSSDADMYVSLLSSDDESESSLIEYRTTNSPVVTTEAGDYDCVIAECTGKEVQRSNTSLLGNSEVVLLETEVFPSKFTDPESLNKNVKTNSSYTTRSASLSLGNINSRSGSSSELAENIINNDECLYPSSQTHSNIENCRISNLVSLHSSSLPIIFAKQSNVDYVDTSDFVSCSSRAEICDDNPTFAMQGSIECQDKMCLTSSMQSLPTLCLKDNSPSSILEKIGDNIENIFQKVPAEKACEISKLAWFSSDDFVNNSVNVQDASITSKENNTCMDEITLSVQNTSSSASTSTDEIQMEERMVSESRCFTSEYNGDDVNSSPVVSVPIHTLDLSTASSDSLEISSYPTCTESTSSEMNVTSQSLSSSVSSDVDTFGKTTLDSLQTECISDTQCTQILESDMGRLSVNLRAVDNNSKITVVDDEQCTIDDDCSLSSMSTIECPFGQTTSCSEMYASELNGVFAASSPHSAQDAKVGNQTCMNNMPQVCVPSSHNLEDFNTVNEVCNVTGSAQLNCDIAYFSDETNSSDTLPQVYVPSVQEGRDARDGCRIINNQAFVGSNRNMKNSATECRSDVDKILDPMGSLVSGDSTRSSADLLRDIDSSSSSCERRAVRRPSAAAINRVLARRMYQSFDCPWRYISVFNIPWCCHNPAACRQFHGPNKGNCVRELEHSFSEMVEAQMNQSHWPQALDFLINNITPEVYPRVCSMRRICNFILNTHDNMLRTTATQILKTLLRTHPPCADRMSFYYKTLLVESVVMRDGHVSNGLIFSIITLIENELEPQGENGRSDQVYAPRSPVHHDSDSDDNVNWDTIPPEELDAFIQVRFEKEQKLYDGPAPRYEDLPNEERIHRLFVLLEFVLDVLEQELLVWVVKYSFRAVQAAASHGTKPLVALAVWGSSKVIGHSKFCKRLVHLYLTCHAAGWSNAYKKQFLRFVTLVAILVFTVDQSELYEYPHFGANCEDLAQDIATIIMDSELSVSERALVVADLEPPWLCLYVCHSATNRLSGIFRELNLGTMTENIKSVALLMKEESSSSLRRTELVSNSSPESHQEVAIEDKRHHGVNKRKATGETRLHVVCRNNRVVELRQLVGIPGVDVNARDNHGWTPLHEAAHYGHVDCVELLLQYQLPSGVMGVDPRVANNEGMTPLIDAVDMNHVDVCKVLVRFGGADLLLDKMNGKSALDWAVTPEMKDVLKSASGHCKFNHLQHLSHSSLEELSELLPVMVRSYLNVYEVLTVTLDLLQLRGEMDDIDQEAEFLREGKRKLNFDISRYKKDYYDFRNLQAMIKKLQFSDNTDLVQSLAIYILS